MTSILAKQKVSKRSLTLNKSFILSLTFHLFLVFGITFTTFYTIPVLENSPIINVKFANSSQDVIGYDGFQQNESLPNEEGLESMQNIVPQKNSYQARKVKKLESNSLVNTEEAVYLNLWQRNIESIGDEKKNIKGLDLLGKVRFSGTNGNFRSVWALYTENDNWAPVEDINELKKHVFPSLQYDIVPDLVHSFSLDEHMARFVAAKIARQVNPGPWEKSMPLSGHNLISRL
mgnify:CR=1 FL=1